MPRLKIQTSLDTQNKKNAIVETAIDIILHSSLDELDIDKVTSSVGIGRTLFYHYFKNKDALLEEIVLYIENKLFPDLLIDLRYPKKTIQSITRAYLKEIGNNSTVFLVDLSFQIGLRLDSISQLKYPAPTMLYSLKQSFKELNNSGELILSLKDSIDTYLMLIYGQIKNRIENSNPISLSANQISKILFKEI